VALSAGAAPAIDAAASAADPAHAFLRAAWFAAAGGAASTLVATRPDGRVVAALPTVPLRAGLPVGRAVPGSYWPLRSFPLALDANEAELTAFLGDPLTRSTLGAVWRLGPVNEDDPTAQRLIGPARAAGWHVLRRDLSTSFLLDLPTVRGEGAWPRKTTLRKNRWFEKELAKDGPLRFSFHSGADWTAALFDTLAEIERNSWIGERTDGSAAKFLAPQHRRFWEGAVGDPALAARMRVALLHIGDVPAAFAFDIDCAPTCYAIANSYDRRFAKNSPGRVLSYRSFDTLAERGITRIDWGAGDPGYKTTMGAVPGAAIVDYLFVRGAALAAVARRFWR
jgi:CelD/BcsL family acetyltransferase involved in cellulose biosynthesis